MPQDAAGCHPNARDDGAPVPRYKARPRPEGDSGFLGPGRAVQVASKDWKLRSNFPTRFRNSLGLRQNFGRKSGAGQTNICYNTYRFCGCWAMRDLSSIVERPMCLTCKHRMGLARISPGKRGFEERTFECSTCHRIEKISFASDPLKTDAVGWLASELRPPR